VAKFIRSNVTDERPLVLTMTFAPERDPAPVDAADVLQSFDDAERLAERVERYKVPLEQLGAIDAPQWLLGGAPSPLRVRSVKFGSPLELLTLIPWSVVTYGGVWLLLAQIERFWNMPRRIKVESKRLDAEAAQHERDELAAKIETLHLSERYWQTRLGTSGRYLQGPVDAPGFRGVGGALRDADEGELERPDYGF
jgi:hypothetical protein